MSSKSPQPPPPPPPPPPPVPTNPAPPIKPQKAESAGVAKPAKPSKKPTQSNVASASKPAPPPPRPLPVASPVYDHVDAESPPASFSKPAMHDTPASAAIKTDKKHNPFRDSYKEEPQAQEAPTTNTTSTSKESKKTNPFRDSYQEVDTSSPTSAAAATPSKKTNPFRDSYRADEETAESLSSTKSNPFDVDVSDSTRSSDRYHPHHPSGNTKQGSSRANPILSPKHTKALKNDSAHGDSANSSAHGSAQGTSSEAVVLSSAGLFPGEPGNPIYHLNRFSDLWMCAFLFIHTGQFILLLTVGFQALKNGGFGVIVFLALAVIVLTLMARYYTKKSRLSERRNIALNNWVCTPQDEADDVPDIAVLLIAAAAITEGIAFAIFTSVSSGFYEYLSPDGFYTKGTLLQVLRFTSITLLALHRMLRPANRLDPMRTVLELEVISVCWDALDGSTLYELLDGNSDLSHSAAYSIRLLMAAWYVSVGFRIALMFLTNLSPNHPVQRLLMTAPFQLAAQPTVDRTLQGLRLKSIITITMSLADLYAAFLRTGLWANGKLDALQQDMCIKNYLFLSSVAGAYFNYLNTSKKEWNVRELIDWPIEIKIPKRVYQLEICRWMFVASYGLIAALSTSILYTVTDDGGKWTVNLIMDGILLLIFMVYAKNAHVHNPNHEPTAFFKPHEGFFTFPGKMALVMSILLATSLMGARLPAMYYHYNSMAADGSGESYTYDNAMLLVVFTIIPLACFSNFWAISYMLFRKEFTAAPGSYHAIHDPSINMVSAATITEGALDVLSAAVLMQLAANDLPDHVNNAVVLFCLLELINAGQCFALPCMLSGGHDDTPKDLVKYNAYLRTARGLIDFGTIILRVVLWIKYRAVSSVFLVKNLYNLIHTFTQVDRYLGVRYYPDATLFSEYVPSYDWYGMTRTQWRNAIYSERSTPGSSGLGALAGVAAGMSV